MSDTNLNIDAQLTRQEMDSRAGCQCKLPGLELQEMLQVAFDWTKRIDPTFIRPPYPEDCAVIRTAKSPLLLTSEMTPLVGLDLYIAGRIAALHAMSDIYASGGIPKWATVTMVVTQDQPALHRQAVLAGIVTECQKEGAHVSGGQTIIGKDILAGLTVIGQPRSERILTKRGAQKGDCLMLSKPIGVGLVLRGFKLGLADVSLYEDAIAIMTTSNASASAAAIDAVVHASTDVTGFGLLGHLAEMLSPNSGAVLELSKVPRIAKIAELIPQVSQSVWMEHNLEYANSHCDVSGITTPILLAIVLDPQTNGGLLVCAPKASEHELSSKGFTYVGEVTDSGTIEILG